MSRYFCEGKTPVQLGGQTPWSSEHLDDEPMLKNAWVWSLSRSALLVRFLPMVLTNRPNQVKSGQVRSGQGRALDFKSEKSFTDKV